MARKDSTSAISDDRDRLAGIHLGRQLAEEIELGENSSVLVSQETNCRIDSMLRQMSDAEQQAGERADRRRSLRRS